LCLFFPVSSIPPFLTFVSLLPCVKYFFSPALSSPFLPVMFVRLFVLPVSCTLSCVSCLVFCTSSFLRLVSLFYFAPCLSFPVFCVYSSLCFVRLLYLNRISPFRCFLSFSPMFCVFSFLDPFFPVAGCSFT
jgi:hypothetical protein